MQFVRSKVVSLKAHDTYNEKWLQNLIADDPTVLGLGQLDVKDVERRQPRAGRLDLLLADPETHTRYEVEIQLGATDEAHIIRTIEYWDVEKSRYPQYEHVAVLVAEDITSRFLNVITLFNKAIPLIAIQMRALDVGGVLTLNATRVLDLTTLGTEDEEEPGQAVDRAYWVGRSSQESLALAEDFEKLIQTVEPAITMKYNKYYIGLGRGGIPDNFVVIWPKRDHVVGGFKIPRTDEMTALIEDSGLDSLSYEKAGGRYRIRLTKPDITTRRDAVLELIRRANGTPAVEESE
jgi:hypothetical protein